MDILGAYNQIFFPQQKIATNKKTDVFYKRCIDSCETMLYYRSGLSRTKQIDIESNLNIYKGIAIPDDMEKMFNPMDIDGITFPSETRNYPICAPKIDLLVGEEYMRRDSWMIRSMNDSAISAKQDEQMEMMLNLLMQELEDPNAAPEDSQKKIQKMGKYLKYTWKDATELTATRLLNYIYKEQNLKKKFNDGMLDHLVTSREIYRVDEVNGEVVVEKCDPRQIHVLGYTNDFKVEDADVVIQIHYLPVGKVIDEFYDYLSDEDIKYLEGGIAVKRDEGVLNYNYVNPRLYFPVNLSDDDPRLLEVDNEMSNYGYVGPFDDKGNIRVVRTRWRGRRKIGKLTYIDEFGDEQTDWVSEKYVIDPDKGEKIKWVWINEAYEGTKLAGRIYAKYGPRKFQRRYINNKSKCDLGFIGTDCGISMMARMKPFQFAYNIYMRRLELIVARFGGPIIEIDTSKIPDDWELDKWMYYMHVLGYMITDPWNEGKKGASLGKIAGNFNTSNKAISPEIGNFIQQNISMLNYIEQQLGTIAGVTKQREGQVDNRETASGVERAVTQSSHITERWFLIHEDTKRRVLQACIDVAKGIYKGKNVKADYVLDDMSRVILDFDGDDLAYTDFDIFVHSSSEDMRIRQMIEGLGQSMVQRGSPASVLLNIIKSDSISEMSRLLEESEDQLAQQAAEQQQKQLESQEKIQQAMLADKEKDRELKKYEIDMKWDIAVLQADIQKEAANEQSDLQMKIQEHESKMQLEYDKLNSDKEKTDKELKEKKRQNEAAFDETRRQNKAKEDEATRHNRVMESKPKATSK
jgi:hypothetical protein